jgi:ABC-type transport system involved in cytochrome bd biosynthesis fused ATPase/permease subunit
LSQNLRVALDFGKEKRAASDERARKAESLRLTEARQRADLQDKLNELKAKLAAQNNARSDLEVPKAKADLLAELDAEKAQMNKTKRESPEQDDWRSHSFSVLPKLE